MDRFDFQQSKLDLMPTAEERELALMLWRAQAERERAETAMAEFYTPLVQACSTPEELKALIRRIPQTVTLSFIVDYLNYGRDWSLSHEDSEAARIAKNEARKA